MSPATVFSFSSLWEAARRAATGEALAPLRGLVRVTAAKIALRGPPVDALVADRWQPSRPRLLAVHDPKPRLISVLPFSDRVVHQALGAVLVPRIERRLILRDTYASRQGLGTHAALRRARAWARAWPWYVHLDVARYFPSIDHSVVRQQLARDVPEPWLQSLCHRILDAGVTPPSGGTFLATTCSHRSTVPWVSRWAASPPSCGPTACSTRWITSSGPSPPPRLSPVHGQHAAVPP